MHCTKIYNRTRRERRLAEKRWFQCTRQKKETDPGEKRKARVSTLYEWGKIKVWKLVGRKTALVVQEITESKENEREREKR